MCGFYCADVNTQICVTVANVAVDSQTKDLHVNVLKMENVRYNDNLLKRSCI